MFLWLCRQNSSLSKYHRLPELKSAKETEPPSKVCRFHWRSLKYFLSFFVLHATKATLYFLWVFNLSLFLRSLMNQSLFVCFILRFCGLRLVVSGAGCGGVCAFVLLVMKSISHVLVWQKRKLSDKPVEAGEDYTKFNSGDFARKVSARILGNILSGFKPHLFHFKSNSRLFNFFPEPSVIV